MKTKKNTNEFIAEIDRTIHNIRNIKDLCALLFQENSKLDKFTIIKQGENIGGFSNPYLTQRISQPYKCFPGSKVVSMKDYANMKPLSFNLFETIAERRSVRKYKNYEISLNEIYTILQYSYGITDCQPIKGSKGMWSYRAVPSGGALYPLEIYLYINNGMIPKGVYHYRGDLNALELINEEIEMTDFQRILVAEPYIQLKNASCIIFISSVLERSLLKYGERGYRFILQEVGYVSQNISLICTALKLGTCMIGSYIDDEMNEIIKADGVLETIQNVIVVGKKHEE